MPASDPSFLNDVVKTLAENRTVILTAATCAIASAAGAVGGAQAILSLQGRARREEILYTANASVAALIALLGKLINFKKDYAFPADIDAAAFGRTLAELEQHAEGAPEERRSMSITLEPWVEAPFLLDLPREKLFQHAGRQLDLIQLVKMLEYNLAELSHLVRQRNALIAQMNAHQAAHKKLPIEGVRLYIKYADMIARNVDENLFFLDKCIERTRKAAQAQLPRHMQGRLADVKLREEASPLMPPADLIKGY